MKTNIKTKPQQLFFLQDLLMGDRTVYSGHDGTGSKFRMFQSDYGKYAMTRCTKAMCEKLKEKIEKAAVGKYEFNWNIVPITEIELCNFYEDEDYDNFLKLQNEQRELFK